MNSPKTEFNIFVLLKTVFFNKYGIVFITFAVWMTFFDSQNIFVQYSLSNRIENLEKEKLEFLVKFEKTEQEKNYIDNDIEKFAREKYYMHKENEEVFIIK